ncbi:MAG: hypothetical protein HY260_21675 [Chloroflexi bacterium]|nr:hypothetical protein [Chloroflexota bacterium]
MTDDKIQMLMLRIDQAEARAIQQTGGDKSVSRLNLNQIEAARNLLLGGRSNYEDAEREIGEVEARLITAEKVRRWSYTWGLGILAYDLVWLGGLLYLGVFVTPQFLKFATAATQNAAAAAALWTAVLAGGLGGVTGSLYNLWTHVAKEQDFDPQHLMWYITNPIMGAVLGIFVYMVVVGGTVTIASGGLGDKSNGIIAVLAWLCGFQQNVAYELVERAIAVFRKPKDQAGTAPATTPEAATASAAQR